MFENPYKCTLELNELRVDESIIDYAVFSDDSFLLIILLTSNGETQAYLETRRDLKPRKNVVNVKDICGISTNPLTICIGNQAAYVVFGLADGNILVTPIKHIIDVTWGGGSWSAINIIDLSMLSISPCLAIPTCTRCFTSNFPPRSMAVMANKAGNILLIDLQLRKCVSELKAPQSLHNIEVLLDENSIELLVTGFTGAQWIIPIEKNGKGFREVLTTCVPSDLKVLEPSDVQFFSSDFCGIVALKTNDSVVEVYPTFRSLANSSKKIFKVPPDTWLVHSGENVIFTVSNNNEIYSALHFGLMGTRIEYTIIQIDGGWKPLGMVAMPGRTNQLGGMFVINERGLVRVEQSPEISLAKIASEFIFRLSSVQLSQKSIEQVSHACGIDVAELQTSLIPNILNSRRDRTLNAKEISQILHVSKVIKKTMPDLLQIFDKEGMAEQLLPEILNAIQSNPARNGETLMQKVVELFVKRALAARGDEKKRIECDSSLSIFLSRHENVYHGAVECLKAGLWRSTQTLAQRYIHATKQTDICAEILAYIIKNGIDVWKAANSADRLQIISIVCDLDWSKMSDSDGAKICAFLSSWQRDISLPSYHEKCLRAANTNATLFPRPCQILRIVSSIYILAETRIINPCFSPELRPLAAGNNCGGAIADDDRIMIWGNFTNSQQRNVDIAQANQKLNKSSTVSSSSTELLSKPEKNLPRVLDYPGRRPVAIACGSEHVLVLLSSGQLSAWGGNRYGQCGVGHNYRVEQLQTIEGSWPVIKKIACGQFHSAFIGDDGSLWTFGWGMYGQLGRGGRYNGNASFPVKIEGLISKIVQVECGRAHTVVLTENGRVLVAGSGSYGQLGTDEDVKKTFAFTPIDIEGSVVQIASSYYHSICLTEENRVFEWGRNPQEMKMRMFVMKKLKSAQMKNGDSGSSPAQRVNLNLPADIPRNDLGLREVKHLLDGNIVRIACGLSHSALITKHGSLYTWGKSLDYQLGHGYKSERSEPHQVFEPKAKWKYVALGNNHTLASTENGDIYGWGKNDFAQCGTFAKKPTAGNESPKKYYFQYKDGRRFIPNIDESQYVQNPSMICDVRLRTVCSGSPGESINEEKIAETLKLADITVVQAVSKHLCVSLESVESEYESCSYNHEDGPLCTATALVHLIAGELIRAIRLVGWLKNDKFTTKESLQTLSSLIWEVVANHEDLHSKQALCAAFRHIPMSDSMRRGKQIAQLWPIIWNDEEAQKRLSIDEKIEMLDGFTSHQASKKEKLATLSSSSLSVSSNIRVFSQCSHAEPAVSGAPPDCTTCLDEWTEKVRATLGNGS